MKLILLLFCAILIGKSNQANVLIVSTLLSHSHQFWNEAIAIGLVEKGHNVTMLTHDTTKTKRDNFTLITLEGVFEAFHESHTYEWLAEMTIDSFKIFSFVEYFWNYNLDVCRKDITHETLHKGLLSYPKEFKFDVILWDHTAGECLYPIIQRFGNPPVIGLSALGISNSIDDIYGAHVYTYVGQSVILFVEAKTIWQRLVNAIYYNYSNYKRRTTFKQETIEISRRTFWDWDENKFDQIEERFSVCLVNWNAALNQPQPLNPNLIPIGGVQIKETTKLPKDFQEIYTKSQTGVIYFSLGSHLKSELLSDDILQSFAQCFSKMPDYEIIWKIKPPEKLKLPSNVHAVPWAPQATILNQPKTKLFITHGGGLSVQEIAYFGVPILGIPIFLDQIYNVELIKQKGGGESLTIDELGSSEDWFCQRLKKVLYNEKYAASMKVLSAKYRDVEVKPVDTAVYWVEYILRHGDIKHLSPLSRNMSMFYTQNLDLYLLLVGLLVSQIFIVYMIVKCFWRRCCRNTEKQKTN